VKSYELAIVFKPDISEEDYDNEIDLVEKYIADINGSVKDIERLIKRRLAYEIDRYAEGIYTFISFSCDASSIQVLNSKLRINENILRYLICVDHTESSSTDTNKKENDVTVEEQ
jgi:small subunit ribosomal protein S6